MRTAIARTLGCEVPIFAFSHCRDVVVEVTKAGGFGVLGAATFGRRQLEAAETEGEAGHPERPIPDAHREFMEKILLDADAPPLPEEDRGRASFTTRCTRAWCGRNARNSVPFPSVRPSAR